MMFYTVVAGWMIYYVGVCAKGTLRQANVKEIEQYYQSFMQTPGKMMFFMLLVVALCIGVCALGLQNGIEKYYKENDVSIDRIDGCYGSQFSHVKRKQ